MRCGLEELLGLSVGHVESAHFQPKMSELQPIQTLHREILEALMHSPEVKPIPKPPPRNLHHKHLTIRILPKRRHNIQHSRQVTHLRIDKGCRLYGGTVDVLDPSKDH